jgi:hypothetical protein
MEAYQLDYLNKMIAVVCCGCVLPIVWIWLQTRRKISESKDRTQIVMAALEKNPDMDVEELVKKMAPQKRLLKEKLLTKLLLGGIFTFLGFGILGFCTFHGYVGGMNSFDLQVFSLFGAIPSGIGIAFLVNFFVGKKMLAKEMEAEQMNVMSEKR